MQNNAISLNTDFPITDKTYKAEILNLETLKMFVFYCVKISLGISVVVNY